MSGTAGSISITGSDAEFALLCDDDGAGTVTPFLRRYSTSPAGTVTTTDTGLDGSTAYTVTGTVTVCSAPAAADPVELTVHGTQDTDWSLAAGCGLGDARRLHRHRHGHDRRRDADRPGRGDAHVVGGRGRRGHAHRHAGDRRHGTGRVLVGHLDHPAVSTAGHYSPPAPRVARATAVTNGSGDAVFTWSPPFAAPP